MSAEFMSFEAEQSDASRPRHLTPAEMITSLEASRRVFADFMGRYVGSPSELRRLASREVPPVERRTRRGNIVYMEVETSGYTGLGSLVHVRINRQEKDLASRYFVVTGDLRSGEMEERVVVDMDNQFTRGHQIETTLYLGHPSNEYYPREYWPSVKMTQQGFYYCPGFEQREEQIQEPGRLYEQCVGKVAMKATRLKSVKKAEKFR